MPAQSPHEYGVHVGAQDKAERIDVFALLAELRQTWWDDAACKGQIHLMFPDKRSTPAAQIHRALALCDGCRVRRECAQAGLSESYGIWGGHFREPHKGRRMTVGRCLSDGEWWSSADLAIHVGRSEAHVHAQMKKLAHHWPIICRRVDGMTEYKRDDK
jgi:hypothetical protein